MNLLSVPMPANENRGGKYPHQVAVNLDKVNYDYYFELAEADQRRLGEYIRITLDKLRLERTKPNE